VASLTAILPRHLPPDDAAAKGSNGADPEASPEPVAAPVTQASVVPPAAEPEPEPAAPSQPEPPAVDASVSSASSKPEPAALTVREGRRRSDPVGELVDEIVAAEAASDAAASRAAPSVSGEKHEPPAAVELGDAVASAIGVKDRGTGAPLSRGSPRTTPPTNDKRAAVARGRARRTRDGKTPAVPARGGSKDLGGNLGIAAVMVVAAVVTYGLVTGVRTMLAESPAKPAESASVAPTSPPSAPSSASSVAPVASAPVLSSLRAEDLELPAGLTVSQDRGLLEVDVDQTISVYVDGVFIGKGPVRQVPLREGAHEIHVQGASVDMVQPIVVHRGRRARVEMTRAP